MKFRLLYTYICIMNMHFLVLLCSKTFYQLDNAHLEFVWSETFCSDVKFVSESFF